MDLKDFKIQKTGRLFFMAAGDNQQSVKKGFSITTDGNFIYYYHPEKGIYKLGVGSQGSMIGKIY